MIDAEPSDTEASPTTGSGRRGGRSPALQAAVFAVLAGAVALVISGLVPGSGQRLRHAAVGWIVVEVILELIACIAYAALFRGVFGGRGRELGYIRSAQIAIGELGAFVVVPTGAGGPALRIWALLRSGMPFRTQMVRSVVHAAIFNLPYLLAALLLGTSVALGVGPGHAPIAVALAPLGVVLVTVLIAAAAALFARRLGGQPEGRWARVGRDVIEAIPDGVRELPARLRQPSLLLAATAYWAGDCGVLAVAFHAAHDSAPIGVVVLAYMLGQLGNALPLPGGVGGVEPIMLGVLTASGVGLGLGAAAIILYRFVSLGIQAVAGAIAVVTLTASLPRAPRDAKARSATR
ncbi:MAG: flippase-like domain-containing protein [Actinomycetota bacterium]|nr:flippase-like domain-containing protein [Actinomycetota bacterium]